jgi:hypothetical protein
MEVVPVPVRGRDHAPLWPVALNALGVVVVLGMVAAMFAAGDRKLPAKPAQAGRNRNADQVSSSEI